MAEIEILRRVQEVAFTEVLNALSATECFEDNGHSKKILRKAGASIRQLNPQPKKGMLRVWGRLANAPVGYERKHPVIIPYKHHVTDLIIKQCYGVRIYLIVFKRDVLDSEREVGSTACDRNVHELSTAEKDMSRRTVHGKFTGR